MSKKDFIKLLRGNKPLFVNVQLTGNDCWYVQAVKSNMLLVISDHQAETEYEVVERDDAIYVN